MQEKPIDKKPINPATVWPVRDFRGRNTWLSKDDVIRFDLDGRYKRYGLDPKKIVERIMQERERLIEDNHELDLFAFRYQIGDSEKGLKYHEKEFLIAAGFSTTLRIVAGEADIGVGYILNPIKSDVKDSDVDGKLTMIVCRVSDPERSFIRDGRDGLAFKVYTLEGNAQGHNLGQVGIPTLDRDSTMEVFFHGDATSPNKLTLTERLGPGYDLQERQMIFVYEPIRGETK